MPTHPLHTAARLPDGTIAVLDRARGRWIWINPDAGRVLDALLAHGTTGPLAHTLTAQGQDAQQVRAVLAEVEQALAADGLLPAPAGTEPPAAVAPVSGPRPPVGRPRLGQRLAAAAGLVVGVAVVKALPLRTLLALARVVRRLPAATPRRAAAVHAAVLAARPAWWPGRLACLEVATATLIAVALTGRRVHLVLGARPLPNQAHAWITTTSGRAVGAHAPDRPWTPVYTVPTLPATPPVPFIRTGESHFTGR